MAEKNYTIPINESFEQFEGCPVCRLYNQLESRSLEYIMGAAMMEPDVRIHTNKTGFCIKHYGDMLRMKNRLSLALMLETHIQEIETLLKAAAEGKKALKSSTARLAHIAKNCFVCDRIEYTMDRYIDNIVHLWKEDPLFQEKLQKQPMICFNHAAVLFQKACDALPPKQLLPFIQVLSHVLRKNLDPVSDQIAKYTKSYDYRFAGMDLGDAKFAVEHAIEFLTGQPGLNTAE